MKMVVIGGGATGIASAILARSKGFDVELYESNEVLGGVLRDINYEDEWYFNNTQYLETDSIIIKNRYSRKFERKINTFKHQYASFTETDEETLFLKDIALPVFSSEPVNILGINEAPINIVKRFKLYGKNEGFMLRMAGRYYNLNDLHISSLKGMALERVFYKNYIDEVRRIKLSNAIGDSLYALPRKIINTEHSLEAALPIEGYNKLIIELELLLLNLGVKIHKSVPIKAIRQDGQIVLQNRARKIDFDYAVWCANPTNLIKVSLNSRLDNIPVKTFCAVGLCKHIPELKPFYIHVFSIKNHITRLFLYNDGCKTKICIEGIGHKYDVKKIEFETNRILSYCKEFQTKINSNLLFVSQKRFTLLSNKDMNLFNEYERTWYNHRIIPGGWQLYGRESKIAYINSHIDNIETSCLKNSYFIKGQGL